MKDQRIKINIQDNERYRILNEIAGSETKMIRFVNVDLNKCFEYVLGIFYTNKEISRNEFIKALKRWESGEKMNRFFKENPTILQSYRSYKEVLERQKEQYLINCN